MNRESFRVCVDYNRAFVHREPFSRMFYRDLLVPAAQGASDKYLIGLDEIHSYDLMGNFAIDDPLENIDTKEDNIPAELKTSHSPISRPVSGAKRTWDELAEAVRSVPYLIFAIDRGGMVIAWNEAIELLTGIKARVMVGKGDHAYALPFYGIARSMLIDYIVMPPDAQISDEIPAITRDGDTFIEDLENVTIREKPMVIWEKGTGIYNAQGLTVAAIQSILVNKPPMVKTLLGISDQEKYIGGI